MIKKLFLIFAFSFFLTGCQTEAQKAQKLADQRAYDDRICKGYGFEAGTDGYANCRMQMNMERQAREREAWSALSRSLNNMPKSTYCSSTGTVLGSTVTSNTYCY